MTLGYIAAREIGFFSLARSLFLSNLKKKLLSLSNDFENWFRKSPREGFYGPRDNDQSSTDFFFLYFFFLFELHFAWEENISCLSKKWDGNPMRMMAKKKKLKARKKTEKNLKCQLEKRNSSLRLRNNVVTSITSYHIFHVHSKKEDASTDVWECLEETQTSTKKSRLLFI